MQHTPVHTHDHPATAGALVTGAFAWLAHIALDRGMGFRLRTRDGFQRG